MQRHLRLDWVAYASHGLCLAGLAFPWLNPAATGPSVSVDPWLVSAACATLLFALRGSFALDWRVAFVLAVVAFWPLARSGLSLETLAALGGGALVLMMMGVAVRLDGQQPSPIAQAWVIASVVSTAIALVQYVGWADHLSGWVAAAPAGEAWGNLRQRNQFASLTAIGTAGVLWHVRTRGARGLHWVGAAWLALGNAATISRTGMLQLLSVVIISAAWQGPNRREIRFIGLSALVAYAIGTLLLPFVLWYLQGQESARLWDRFNTGAACGSRWTLWSNVVHLIAEKPVLGWGWGELDFAHFTTLYDGPRFCDILDNAHNLVLHTAVELGTPAALLLCGVALWFLLRARPWLETNPTRQLAWLVLTVIFVHSLLEYPLWYGPFQIALGLSLGLLCAGPAKPSSGMLPERRLNRTWPFLWSALLLMAITFAAWDYRRVSQLYLAPEARLPAYREDTLAKIRGSWLFRNQALFAELTITPLTRDNALWTHDSASALLHFSPEPRVIEKLIDSSVMLGRSDEAVLQLARFRAAFPEAYATWRQTGAPAP